MQLEAKIQMIKTQLDKAKNELYKAEAKLDNLEKQEEEILKESKELGVDPACLPEEISRLEKEIEEELQRAWNLLPQGEEK